MSRSDDLGLSGGMVTGMPATARYFVAPDGSILGASGSNARALALMHKNESAYIDTLNRFAQYPKYQALLTQFHDAALAAAENGDPGADVQAALFAGDVKPPKQQQYVFHPSGQNTGDPNQSSQTSLPSINDVNLGAPSGVSISPGDFGGVVVNDIDQRASINDEASGVDAMALMTSVTAQTNVAAQIVQMRQAEYFADRLEYGDAARHINVAVNSAEQSVDQTRQRLAGAGPLGKFLATNIGIAEGGSLALYGMAAGTLNLARNVGELINPDTWSIDPSSNIDRLKSVYGTAKFVNGIASFASNPVTSTQNG